MKKITILLFLLTALVSNAQFNYQSTIRNNFRVFTTAVEVFLELLYDIGERAEKSSARTKELNKLGYTNVKVTIAKILKEVTIYQQMMKNKGVPNIR